MPKSREEVEGRKPQLIARMIESLPDLPPEFIASRMDEALFEQGLDELNSRTKMSLERTSGNMGVFCLAECIDSVLMWSHYAANHQGIALRFDIGVPKRTGLPPFFKIRYLDERPSLGVLLEGSTKSGDITDALARKAKFWEYEQEWRSFSPNGAGQFITYEPTVVTGIIFGAKCSDENQAETRQIVQSRNIEFFKVAPSSETFQLAFTQC
jgi:Protein of unknown function (DUF2971)